MRLLISGGRVVDPAQNLDAPADVLLEGPKVAAVGRGLAERPGLRGVPRLNAAGCWVLPGLIDLHVHLREPGREEDETFATGGRAAAAGGVTTLVAMANTSPTPDSPARLRALRARARRDSPVEVLFAAPVTRGLGGRVLVDFEALAAAGAAAFSDDGRPVGDSALLRGALEALRETGRPLLDHAEDPGLAGGGAFHEGAARRLGVPGIPHAAETLPSLRDLLLAELCGGRLHLCHVSCAAVVALVREARRRGAAVTAEAAPHHLLLDEDDVPRSAARAPFFKMNPPLRTAADRAALLAGLADGTIGAVATDHAPHAAAKKALGARRAPCGVIGLETLAPAALELVRRGTLDRRRLAERLALGPARILGLRTKGRLTRGADADVCVLDPNDPFTLGPEFRSKSGNSPFIGRRFPGRVRATVSGGRVVFLRARSAR
ncbi:MAG: dihydroorotase [Elusimicrobiota bacterium]|jgi:dihydroorotase